MVVAGQPPHPLCVVVALVRQVRPIVPGLVVYHYYNYQKQNEKAHHALPTTHSMCTRIHDERKTNANARCHLSTTTTTTTTIIITIIIIIMDEYIENQVKTRPQLPITMMDE